MRIINTQTARKIAKKYYTEETYKHVRRVAKYVQENNMIPSNIQNDCIVLAYLHDLLEDTDFRKSKEYTDMPEYTKTALDLLTHDKDNISYDGYCRKIKESTGSITGKCAWYVKIADMKDHLSKTDTLTDALKEKYINGLRYLL